MHPAVRVLPHVNDTLLLSAAITMVAVAPLDPLRLPWLSAKIVGLIAYIVFGAVALGPGMPARSRATAFAAALAIFGYVVSVALTKNPLGAGAWLLH